jgi:hypothetical protein
VEALVSGQHLLASVTVLASALSASTNKHVVRDGILGILNTDLEKKSSGIATQKMASTRSLRPRRESHAQLRAA